MVLERSALSMKGRRLCTQDGLFGMLDDNLMLDILEKISDRVDRQAWCLVCRRFLGLAAISRKKVQLMRVEVLEQVLHRYTKVEELDLSMCLQLHDDILETIGRLSGHRLRSIILARNSQFSDAGLHGLFLHCPNLKKLNLGNCHQIADFGVSAIGQLKNLESLELVNCPYITDVGLESIAAGCEFLRHLSLRGCLGVSDVGISLVAVNCKKLESLDLSYTEVTADGLRSIAELQFLKNLILASCNRVDDAGLSCLKKCGASLRVLDVARCHGVTDRGIVELARGAVRLERLTLSYCRPIKHGLAASFQKFKGLQVIRLDGCDIAGTGLAFISNGCKPLKEFSASKCTGVTDQEIRAVVEGCRNLRALDLTCCRDLTDLALASIASSCRGLLSLKMESCSLVTDRGVSLLANGCAGLEELDFTDCSIDDEGLKWLSKCTALRTLKLGICLNISDTGIEHIAAGCRNLLEIDLYRSASIGDRSAAAIASGCPRLKTINISYCTGITDTGLRSLSLLRDLSRLEMRACWAVTSFGLSYIAAGCKQLIELDVKHCAGIDDQGYIFIAQGCPNLRQVNLSFCNITDVGLLAIARLSCMQNMKLLHLRKVTVDGLAAALFNSGTLKKVKLISSLQLSFPEIKQTIEARGCTFRWESKHSS